VVIVLVVCLSIVIVAINNPHNTDVCQRQIPEHNPHANEGFVPLTLQSKGPKESIGSLPKQGTFQSMRTVIPSTVLPTHPCRHHEATHSKPE